ncbi:MAG: OmpA family protein [Prevotellaceae bacterium]|nr:OmpA family protein [Candidatus Faecinaster equi]
MKKMRLYLSLLLVVFVLGATAQETKTVCNEGNCCGSKSYMFFGVQGGAQVVPTNYKFTELVMPTVGAYFGAYFSPVVGARLHGMGFRSKGGFKSIDKTYMYDYVTTDADLLINLSNLFCKKRCHSVNLVLLGGVGLNYAWHNGEVDDIIKANPDLYVVSPNEWTKSRFSHNLRVGLQMDVNIAKHWGVNLEVDANNLSDRFNSKKSNTDDWQLTAAVGVTYKFGFKKPAPVPVVVPVVAPAPAPAPVAVVEPTPAPAPAPAPAPELKKIGENIFYNLNSSDIKESEIAKVDNIAKFLKENPNIPISIIGYADVKTGNPKYNLKLSKQRATVLKNTLVEKYGISADRITTDAKGDTVQPFSENDENRCCIVYGSEK